MRIAWEVADSCSRGAHTTLMSVVVYERRERSAHWLYKYITRDNSGSTALIEVSWAVFGDIFVCCNAQISISVHAATTANQPTLRHPSTPESREREREREREPEPVCVAVKQAPIRQNFWSLARFIATFCHSLFIYLSINYLNSIWIFCFFCLELQLGSAQIFKIIIIGDILGRKRKGKI
jgi:hypothetical protein